MQGGKYGKEGCNQECLQHPHKWLLYGKPTNYAFGNYAFGKLSWLIQRVSQMEEIVLELNWNVQLVL